MRLLTLLTAAVLTLPGTVAACAIDDPATPASAPAPDASELPTLRVTRPVRGLANVWDVQVLRGGTWLLTERSTAKLWLRRPGKPLRQVQFPSSRVWVSGETGLMSLAVDPDFATNRRFYSCQGWRTPGGQDVRVIAWTLNKGLTRARLARTLVDGFPTSSGRHGGCRLLIDRETGALLVGTGDAAIGTTPRDKTSLGGKVLRLDRFSGAPWPDNPWIDAENSNQRYLLNFGHRNIQGLAQRDDGTIWSAEHGPDRDDEVNVVLSGADYGWNPVPGYNESVPMTDHKLPGKQTDAAWSSGYPTVATSGMAWVSGEQWGVLDGTLAVAALKDSEVLFMSFSDSGKFRWVQTPPELRKFGRLRSITPLPGGDLLITTDNGADDGVLRVSAR